MEEGAGEAGQLGGSLVVECGDASDGGGWIKDLSIGVVGLVGGFVFAIAGKHVDSYIHRKREKRIFENECKDMMIWAEYAVKSYSQAWKDIADSLTTPGAFNEISLPACKPERMLSAGDGIKNLLDDNKSDYRSAVRSVLVIYDVCNEQYEEVISCRDGIKSYFDESLDSRKRLCEAYRKITVTTALLWSHADNVVSKRFSRSRVPHGWDDEIKLVEERLGEVERALEVDVPRNT